MRTRRGERRGQGTAWLVADRSNGHFNCYWYTGTNDGQLIERADAATTEDAVAWGRARSPRVRIRTRDGEAQWAGTETRPETFAVGWNDSKR
jgi:hypothetical protein